MFVCFFTDLDAYFILIAPDNINFCYLKCEMI